MKTPIATATLSTLRASYSAAKAETDRVLVRYFGGHSPSAIAAAAVLDEQGEDAAIELWGKLGAALVAERRAERLYCAAVAAAA